MNSTKNSLRRILIKKRYLILIYRELKKQRNLTQAKISLIVGGHFSNYLRGITMPEEVFLRFKELIGPDLLLTNFGTNDVPHKIIIGKGGFEEVFLEENQKIAELIGIMLGDGNIGLYSNAVNITLNKIDEPEYVEYVKNEIVKKVFNFENYPKEVYLKNSKGVRLDVGNLAIRDALISKGLEPGNKKINQVNVPRWIYKNKSFMVSCLKGLFDTDGTIRIDKRQSLFILEFINSSKPLVKDFKKICNLFNIQTTRIYEKTAISDISGKTSIKFLVRIQKKESVLRFIKIVDPEKFKEVFRRQYLGTILIYLSAPKDIRKKIEIKISSDYPKVSKREYSKEFSCYIKKISEYFLGYEITPEKIENALKKAFIFNRYIYQKDKAEFLKNLFEQLGSFEAIIGYLRKLQFPPYPKQETIRKHINKYLKTVEGINFEVWSKQISPPIIIKGNKIKFPRELRLRISNFIYKNLLCNLNLYKNYQIIDQLISSIYKFNILKIVLILEDPNKKKDLINYFKALARLIYRIIQISNSPDLNALNLSKDTCLNLQFKYEIINEILKYLQANYPKNFSKIN